MTVLVTGGAGFIGANFLNLFVPRFPERTFVNIDCLTYAGSPASLQALEGRPNYAFARVDITRPEAVQELFAKVRPDLVVHFAAESHVDRSIRRPARFVETNVVGTLNLLEAFRALPRMEQRLFHHVSTDEVYGALGDEGVFAEVSPYNPTNPYSASKAASDHLVRAWHRTYGLPVTITNCSNNFGPYQSPEKFMPMMILNALSGRPMPVYGRGENVRDWLFVEDHCESIWKVIEHRNVGQTYNIGGSNERRNIDVAYTICDVVASEIGGAPDRLRRLVTFVDDRPGHDWRYAMDSSKLERDCGPIRRTPFEEGLRRTVRFYRDNPDWVQAAQAAISSD